MKLRVRREVLVIFLRLTRFVQLTTSLFSPIEIAALDPHIEVRSANALDILRYALEIGAPSVKVNAINPSTVLSAAQIRELLEIVREQEAVFGASPAGASAPA